MRKFLIFTILLFSFNIVDVKANIVCNDGTVSPSCSVCKKGCCSRHGGCSYNAKPKKTKAKTTKKIKTTTTAYKTTAVLTTTTEPITTTTESTTTTETTTTTSSTSSSSKSTTTTTKENINYNANDDSSINNENNDNDYIVPGIIGLSVLGGTYSVSKKKKKK